MLSVRLGKRVKLNISNRWLYTFITLGIFALIGIGVYAYTNPATGVGHSYTEIEPCSNGKILKMINGNWTCADDATGAASVDWNSITNRPPGLDDGDQIGITSETDPKIKTLTKNELCSANSQGTGIDCKRNSYLIIGGIRFFYMSSYTRSNCNNYCVSRSEFIDGEGICIGGWDLQESDPDSMGCGTTALSDRWILCLCAGVRRSDTNL